MAAKTTKKSSNGTRSKEATTSCCCAVATLAKAVEQLECAYCCCEECGDHDGCEACSEALGHTLSALDIMRTHCEECCGGGKAKGRMAKRESESEP